MIATKINAREPHRETPDDLPGLGAYCSQLLVGEPFLFARVTYADEFHLHFGREVPSAARGTRVKPRPRGSHVLSLRASSWLLKSGAGDLVSHGVRFDPGAGPADAGERLTARQVEDGGFVAAGARVLAVAPFGVRQVNAVGAELELSDGSRLIVLPTPIGEGDGGPLDVADWQLLTPDGFLRVGPGVKWEYDPAADAGR